jgi:hypothetical protein
MPAVSDANYPSGYNSPGPLASPLIPDIAHEPSLAYIPYLVTGDRYYADEMAYWADYVLIRTYQDSYSNERGGSLGLLAPNEVRGIGWGLRNLADAAAYLPNNDPVRAYLTQKVQNNLSWADNYAVSHVTPLGTYFDGPDTTYVSNGWSIYRLWMNDYVGWSLDHAADQGFVGGTQLRDKLAQFELSLFTSPDFPREDAGAYDLPVGTTDSSGNPVYYTSLGQVYAAASLNLDSFYEPFQGYYGPETRLMLMIGVRNGWSGAQDAYDYLNPIEATTVYVNGVSDLANRAGWAIALTTTGGTTSGATSAMSISGATMSSSSAASIPSAASATVSTPSSPTAAAAPSQPSLPSPVSSLIEVADVKAPPPRELQPKHRSPFSARANLFHPFQRRHAVQAPVSSPRSAQTKRQGMARE